MKFFKPIFLLLSIFCLLVNCADDDKDEIISSVCQSFLECQEGTVWKLIEVDDDQTYVTYLELNNDLENPLEIFSQSFDGDCYYYMDMSQADGLLEILENSKSKLSVRITGNEDDVTEWDLIVDNERLKLNIRNFENDEMYESFQMFLEGSNVVVNQLKLCDDF